MARNGIVIDGVEEIVDRHLQPLLADLTALALEAKQAHWHVIGRNFTPVHEQLDLIVGDARSWADLVAERAITLGATVDGRPEAVAATTAVTTTPTGFLDDGKVVSLVSDQIGTVAGRAREELDRLGDLDPVTQDLVIEVLTGLEKHLWMLQAQLG
jgi:starvation-inducible DNA-binding protein